MTYPQPHANVDLTFEFPAGSGTVADLTFGATLGPPPGAVYEATFNARFALRGTVTVDYDSAQWRGLRSGTVLGFGQATATQMSTAVAWMPAAPAVRSAALVHGQGRRADRVTSAGWSFPTLATRNAALGFGRAAHAASARAAMGWGLPRPHQSPSALAWAQAGQRGNGVALVFFLAKPAHRSVASPWDVGALMQRAVTARMGRAALALRPAVALPWRVAQLLSSLGGPRFLPGPAMALPVRPDTVADVRFCALYPDTHRTTLVFGVNPCGGITPDAPVYVLPARFYMAVHSLEAQLLPGLTSIPIFDVSLSADSGSFAWTFSASGPAQLFDALAPTGGEPAQIRITLDGMPWVFVVDSLQRQHEFGKTGTRIAGRSATSAVGAPYARELARLNATAQNAQQLAAAALNLTGVDLDWGIADWLVPAGAWSHMGTPLSAVQAIAEAAGGYVNSHRSAPTLLVRHPYPTLPGGIPGGPWNWGGAFAADVELAPDAIITSSIERRDGPDLDGIYVSGANQGVLGLVRRTGTTGSKLATMVTDPLITANAAAQQRGLSVLGQSGPKHIVQISMPILTGGTNPGVLDVGQLVQINESVPWRGRVRSVGVQASMPTARQQITLERHL